jgi:hypothetical protein
VGEFHIKPLANLVTDAARLTQVFGMSSVELRFLGAPRGLLCNNGGGSPWAGVRSPAPPRVASPLVVYEPVEVVSAVAVEREP